MSIQSATIIDLLRVILLWQMASFGNYTLCLKNDTDVAQYNFYADRLVIIFWQRCC